MPLRDRIRQKSPQPDVAEAESTSRYDDGIDDWPPPVRETAAQRALRLEEEREAKRVNDEIDLALEAERLERRKRKVDVKILLLGQAESGKSTILRNFQLQFTPQAFRAEAAAWRAVIHLNLVRSVTFILNLLSDAPSSPTARTRAHAPSRPSHATSLSHSTGHGHPDFPLEISTGEYAPAPAPAPLVHMTDELRRLRMRLSPLRTVEAGLAQFLSADSESHPRADPAHRVTERAFEVSVCPGSKWKALFGPAPNPTALAETSTSPRAHPPHYEELEDARRVIEACREDMVALWQDETVQESLKNHSMALEFQSGFFLDEVDRIAVPGYEPSPSDILKARIQTMGVEEHILKMETVADNGQTWGIYDVGGSRGQRAAWIPYFDDLNLLLFLAPMSAFNQVLAEDHSVNRLWDSFYIWNTICSSRLLNNVTFVLLLNKLDLLDAKLKAGIQFRRFVTSYKDKPNEADSVVGYIKSKFSAIYKQHSPPGRLLRVHVTCATDSKATSIVLERIRESIVTKHFKSADLL